LIITITDVQKSGMLPKKKSKIYPTLYFRVSLIILGQEILKELPKTSFLKKPAMRKIIGLAVALIWILVSCQKETSTDSPNQNQRTDSICLHHQTTLPNSGTIFLTRAAWTMRRAQVINTEWTVSPHPVHMWEMDRQISASITINKKNLRFMPEILLSPLPCRRFAL
jgi:hypothetical protein